MTILAWGLGKFHDARAGSNLTHQCAVFAQSNKKRTSDSLLPPSHAKADRRVLAPVLAVERNTPADEARNESWVLKSKTNGEC